MDSATNNYCISGSWVLDLTRSDTLEGYLRRMQAPEHLIQTQVAGEGAVESRNVIALQSDRVVIHKATLANNFTEIRYFGVDLVIPTDLGERRSMSSLVKPGDRSGLVTTTKLTCCDHELSIVEVRQLIEHGTAHTQVINIHDITAAKHHVTRRIWRRVPPTVSDIEKMCV